MSMKNWLAMAAAYFLPAKKPKHKTLTIIPKGVVIQPTKGKSGHNSKGAKKSRKKRGY